MEKPVELKQIKLLGGIGSILSLFGSVPRVGLLISLAGFILVLIAIFNLERATKAKGIFGKFLIGNLLSGIAIAIVAFFVSVILGTLIFLKGNRAILLSSVLFLFFCWILMIVGSYLIKKSFEKIAQVTKEENFARAGFFYFIGSITAIVLVGFILNFVGTIFEIIAFFSLPEKL
jgi:uncharacterized membrane protein